ncbi:DNA segregation ATPase FtsK/SpoIIIE, S-DNA-T family [Jatrophihabitans endophyticus]|uniref:DNA segregation ATPase FtsK/SpoIIIE, S-DNA-T family n=1 Tax=Jatrophihabitans endophyticus TaxID=1206085 RepID=A0A1M5PQC0_9ACTN|nr:FtsK/SpoIIIE domain-containing protein [Jatrophihabitans endophyticus]SHH03483.1 DNA segregation ATPase FtsK/SpoIIIE, S-DNA-T family [Jatrophihabitans endophyticus]
MTAAPVRGWTVTVRPSAESGLQPADVTVDPRPGATVGDLAAALGEHLTGGRHGVLVAPLEEGRPWPARRPLTDCGLASGDVLDVVTVPAGWADQPARPSRRRGLLRVVAGPDAGTSHALTADAVTIGRDDDCTVTLSDPLVSRRHASVILGTQPVITDEGSAHGTLVDGAAITGPTALEWGRAVRLGDSAVVVDRAAGDVTGRSAAVLRPPRFGEPQAAGSLDVPAPPSPPRPQPLQWAMFAMPLVFGGAMLAQTRSTFSLAYICGYPVIMLAAWWQQRRRARKEHREALRLWRADVDELIAGLDRAGAAQRVRAQEDHPEFRTLVARTQLRSRSLWTRRPGDADFLACRTGTGPVAATLDATLRDGGDRAAAARARDDLALRRVLDGLAVPVSLATSPVVAVAGPPPRVDAAVRALVSRLAVDHSPADLTITAVLGRHRTHHETWLRWLPHAGRRPGGLAPVAIGAADGATLVDALAGEDRERGVTLCLVDEDAAVPRRLLEAAAASELVADGLLRFVWLGGAAGGVDTVPAATSTLLDLGASVPAPDARAAAARPDRPAPEPVAVLAHRDRGGVQLLTEVDEVGLDEVWRLARAMVECQDEVAVVPAATALPDVTRLPDLVPDLADPDDAAGIRQRWASRRGLRAQLGVGAGGVVSLDLREDGPHGLVAGTTGSGKSELLQTLICSLALNNPPERMTFLLVDYKGGAAFRECADLPHTVGYITDLSPALVQRALTSLGAEITARETLLERYGAKDLAALEAAHPEVAPPSLLICVDEFAALTAEVPDFVDGVVNIAQRGRSLGMHLLLATQRPAGVVTANVRANTDLRIALRVSSVDDSSDVIDSPEAARISRRTPGRAWIRRTGHGTAELVQTGWVGARAELPTGRAPVGVRAFTATGVEAAAPAGTLDPRTDLERLVGAVREAFRSSGAPLPAKPWLPALGTETVLECSERGTVTVGGAAAATRPGQVVIGVLDRPAAQAQGPALLDYAHAGNVLAFGASGSGKTELLRTVAVSAALTDAVAPSVYAIDFGGGALGTLATLPVVGAVIGEGEPERVMRLLRMLRAAVADRNRLLASHGAADVGALRATGLALPRIHVLIDNLPSLLETLEAGGAARRVHADMLAGILQDGRRVGVHVTATSPRRTGISSGLQSAFGQRLVLRMPTDDDYQMLGVPAGVLTQDAAPGRALLGRHELQVATIGGAGTPAQADQLGKLAALLDGDAPAVGVPPMPPRLPQQVMPRPQGDALPLAVDADFVAAVTLPLRRTPLLVAGRSGSGRTGLLLGLAQLARRSDEPPCEIVLVGPRANAVLAGDGELDRVLHDPADVLAWAATPPPAVGWRLVLVDDAHVWERDWEKNGPAREVAVALADVVGAAAVASHTAAVVVTDTDDARTRQHVAGPTQVARRARVGVLLQPDLPDGSVLGASVPTQTVEPLTGPGRGLFCETGRVRVVQVICAGMSGEGGG